MEHEEHAMKKYCPDCGSPLSGSSCRCGYEEDHVFTAPTTCHQCQKEIYRKVIRQDGTWYGLCREHTPECFLDWREKLIEEKMRTMDLPNIPISKEDVLDYLQMYRNYTNKQEKARKEGVRKRERENEGVLTGREVTDEEIESGIEYYESLKATQENNLGVHSE